MHLIWYILHHLLWWIRYSWARSALSVVEIAAASMLRYLHIVMRIRIQGVKNPLCGSGYTVIPATLADCGGTGISRTYRLSVLFRLIYPCFLQCSGSGQNPEPFWSDLVAVAVTSSFCLPICHIESLMIVEIFSSCLLKYRTLVCAIFNQPIKCVA